MGVDAGVHMDGAAEKEAPPRSLVDQVRAHARARAGQTALIFLGDGERETARLCYRELDERARALAARLQAQRLGGQRVLLLLPSGADYVVGFLGCLYAGAVAVPAYPPTSSLHAGRIERIMRDCGARGVLAPSALLPALRARFESNACSAGATWLAADGFEPADAAAWIDRGTGPQDLALLQYTSGSTSDPRGVIVSHGNLQHHARLHAAAWQLRDNDVFVSWLPLFHDMGLIGNIVQPLHQGCCTVLMPSAAFLQRPMRWLEALSRYRGSVTYAPNFAYELCAASATEPQGALRLEGWRIACNAAEPVRADTLRRFAQRFSACGFLADAFVPSYGLAEATLHVTEFAHRPAKGHGLNCSASALEDGWLAPITQPGERCSAVVSVGSAAPGLRVVAVDPRNRQPCAEGRIGEIWVQGPTVAGGYWGQPAATADTFGARLADGSGPFLRTGDLGAWRGGELHITGRLKELIIVRGQNHYPSDIERTAEQAHPVLAMGQGAAFSVEADGQERLVLLLEVRRSERKRFDGRQVADAVRAAVAAQHGLQLHALLLLAPGAVHITSSGKIQRGSSKNAYLRGGFSPLFAWRHSGLDADAADAPQQPASPAAGQAPAESAAELAAWLQRRIAQNQRLPLQAVGLGTAFTDFGIDSMALVALTGALSERLGRSLPPTLLYSWPDIGSLAEHLAGTAAAAAAANTDATDRRTGQPASPRPLDALPPAPAAAGGEPTAIIGMACRFPGAPSVDAYWDLLSRGLDAIAPVPAARWDAAREPLPTRHGGFIDGVDEFDAAFFGVSPREAQGMDPQQRLLLQTAWHALEDAGIVPGTLAGSRTGVFIGISATDYRDLLLAHGVAPDAYQASGNALSIAANRISYALGLQGPSVAVDTACSSSLAALHQARLSLRAGECDLAIVGAVNLLLSPLTSRMLDQAQMLSPRGRCSAFDALADGYVRGEGCGVVVLRRQGDLERAPGRVHALLRGSALNQGGRSNGLTAPNGLAQQAVMRQALADAGIDAAQVGLLEAHGTGTPLGDPIEAESIQAVYGMPSGQAQTLWLGSVKAQIGHLEAAAGMAGLIKAVLAVRHGQLPPHPPLRQLNPAISFDGTRCAMAQALQDWPRGAASGRCAAVSSFGFGGSNAHVIVGEAPPAAAQGPAAAASAQGPHGPWRLLLLSARSERSLQAVAGRHADWLGGAAAQAHGFGAVCEAAATARTHHARRLAVVARSADEAAGLLRARLAGHEPPGVVAGTALPAGPGKLAFLFTGQGSQYPGMGQALDQRHAVFRQALDECDAVARQRLGWSVRQALYAPGEDSGIDLLQTVHGQPALFAYEYALARLWQSLGVEPDCVMGHSLGEFVAACIAGVFSLEDGLALVGHRAQLMQDTPPGAMAVLRAPAALLDAVREELRGGWEGHGDGVVVAACNGPEELLVSGTGPGLVSRIPGWEARGALVLKLHVNRAFHSPLLQGIAQDFEGFARGVRFQPPRLPLVSNVTGRLAGGEVTRPGYWVRQVLAPVLFTQGLRQLEELGCGRFIEIGPHPVLTALGRQALARGHWVPSARRGQDADLQFQLGLAAHHASGGLLDLDAVSGATGGAGAAGVPLPLYPFEPERHWFTAVHPAETAVAGSAEAGHPLVGQALAVAGSRSRHFQALLSPRTSWLLEQHRVHGLPTLPASAMVECVYQALEQATGDAAPGWLLQPIEFKRVLEMAPLASVQWQLQVEPEGGGRRVTGYSRPAGDDGAAWHEHFSATALPAGEAGVWPAHTALSELQAGMTAVDLAGCYERFSRLGVAHGPGYRGLSQCWRGEGRLLAHVELPQLQAELTRYLLHPALLDACLHALMLEVEGGDGQTAYLPHTIQQVRVDRRLPARLWCDMRWQLEPGGAIGAVDLKLLDGDGTCLALLRGLRLARVSRAMLGRPPEPASADAADATLPLSRWQTVWEAIASPDDARPEDRAGEWLIVCPDPASAGAWKTALAAAGQRALAVSQGPSLQWEGRDSVRVPPDDGTSMARLFSQLKASARPVRGLVLAAGAAPPLGDLADAVFENTRHGLAALRQFLAEFGEGQGHGDAPAEVLICTRGAHADVVPGGAALSERGLADSSLHGLAKAVIADCPGIRCVQVDLDPQGHETHPAGAVLTASGALPGSGHVALRGGRAYAARLVPLEDQEKETAPAATPQVRATGAYLVTGGLGALGLAVARWLVDQGARHVLLASRGAPDAAATAAIELLRARGAQVVAVQADVGNALQAQGLLETLRDSSMPPLRGVVHAAGRIDDGALAGQDWPRFEAVMHGKARGALNLHRLTLGMPLDFFVLFSSLASLLGSAGQSGYVVANAVLDALAHHRHGLGLCATSVNWGPWAGAGLAADAALSRRFSQAGLHALQPAAALAALGRALGDGAPQVGIAAIDAPRFAAAQRHEPPYTLLSGWAAGPGAADGPAQMAEVAKLPPDEAKAAILNALFERLARTLRLSPEQQPALREGFRDTRLNSLGLDSLMAVELRNRLQGEWAVEVPVHFFIGGSTAREVAQHVHDQLVVRQLTEPGAPAGQDEETETWTL